MSLVESVKREVQPRLLVPSLTAGLIAGVMEIGVQISLAAFIFSGDLSPFLANGIGLMLFGALVVGIVVGLTTSLPGMVGVPQDTPAALLALMGGGIALAMSIAPPEALFATVLAAIAITSLLMAVIFFVLGRFRLSGFVRYIPYPVVGGFLAATGWLMIQGGFGVMLDERLTLAGIPGLLSLNRIALWLPGLIFAAVLLLVLRRYNHVLITPGMLVLTTALFYGYLSVAGVSIPDATARGWLLGAFPAGGLYRPLTPGLLSQVDWTVVLGQADKIATVLVLSVIALLLNMSALEVTVREDIDMNRELMTAGIANLAGGLGSVPVGYQTIGLSALAHRLGARSRLVNVIAGAVCGVALFFGSALFAYIPKLLLGGMLLYLGLTFVLEWLIDSRRVLPTIDYLLVWVILAIIVAVGFLEGILAGVFIAAILFVVTYSRVNVVRNTMSGRSFQSNVDRPKDHRDLLAQRGEEIHILRLQGFIFFGTIQEILNQIRRRLGDEDRPKLRHIVLDLQRVTRLDSSAVFGIKRLKQLAEANGVLMVWTHVSPTIQGQLERGGLVDKADESFVILPTLDHGVEWCENKILAKHVSGRLTAVIERISGQLRRAFPGIQAAERLTAYLERQVIPEGQYLMRKGDPPTEMYFVEVGMVTAQLETDDGQVVRLRSMRGGTTVGEMGLYLGAARTADVIASRGSIVYRLSAESLQKMRQDEPEVAALLHEWIARQLAERLAAGNRTIEALMD
jgi:SulP family sulfate permease